MTNWTEDILDEISKYNLLVETRKEGDIDKYQISKLYNINLRRALYLMSKISKEGKYESFVVYDPNLGCRIKIIRKKEK